MPLLFISLPQTNLFPIFLTLLSFITLLLPLRLWVSLSPPLTLSLSLHPRRCQGNSVLWRQLVRAHLSSCWPALSCPHPFRLHSLLLFSVILCTKNTEEPNCHTCISQTIMQYKWKWHISVRSSSLIMFMSVHLKWCVFFHVSNSLAMI